MPCKLGLMMSRAQRAARGLIRRDEVDETRLDRRAAPSGGRGRSESSPGHIKRDAGARNARDYAPGRLSRPAGGII